LFNKGLLTYLLKAAGFRQYVEARVIKFLR